MTRVANWKAKEVFGEIKSLALKGARDAVDKQVALAKMLVPVGKIRKPGEFVKRSVSILQRKGKNKGQYNTFLANTWAGREPGSLKRTIRRVEKSGRAGNIRVYAGNYKVFYAHFIERGTRKMRARPFLNPSFEFLKAHVINGIRNYINKHPEVK